eukprot:Protomagalhaensia_wolfi_Nauph_80__4149@NODE_4219_length_612_cov_11_089005_g3354_i0_p1_GENE_NODE_4219_length_612_cov_11_089005_g3354_i0NODE_4219_length_612_cov_11_089005_g3354_i0_p1_ORF_typecomplete_len102_score7_01_NODE_4219_length_612_cov_11_089005_g3354_i0106411
MGEITGPTMLLCHDNHINYRLVSTRFGTQFLTCAASAEVGEELRNLLDTMKAQDAAEDSSGLEISFRKFLKVTAFDFSSSGSCTMLLYATRFGTSLTSIRA